MRCCALCMQDMWVDAQQAALQTAVQTLPRLPEAITLLKAHTIALPYRLGACLMAQNRWCA